MNIPISYIDLVLDLYEEKSISLKNALRLIEYYIFHKPNLYLNYLKVTPKGSLERHSAFLRDFSEKGWLWYCSCYIGFRAA